MIDEAARKQMADIIRAYMNEEIMAFEFNNALDEIRLQTKDRTVEKIFYSLWYHYDDLKNHRIVASKELWDYFHRLLLVLESGAEMETTISRKWSFRQLIAASALAAFVVLAWSLDWGAHLLVGYIALGFVSMLLAYSRSKAIPTLSAVEIASTPFSGTSQVLTARRRVPHFVKWRYPAHLSKRTIRHWILEADLPLLGHVVYGVMWMMFAPVVLLFQAMPQVDFETRVIIPQYSEEPK
jgi:hypothetical protein